MTSAATSNKISGRVSLKLFDHDPGASSATIVSGDGGTTKNYLDMRDYENFLLLVMNSVSTSSSGPSTIAISAAEDASGTNATTIVSTTPSTASTHVGDNIVLECTAAQIKEVGAAAGYNLRYVTGLITCSNSGDECVVGMFRFGPKFPASGLTVNNIT